MHKSAIISTCGKYRYKLTRSWDKTLPHLVFIMLNPSTADADNDDPTIRRLIAFTKRWGYGGFHVVNLFAYRTPSPNELWKAKAAGVDIVGPQNFEYINEVTISRCKVVFAWGGYGHVDDMDVRVSQWFPEAYCIECSGHGFPKHPLYLKSDNELKLVRLDAKERKFLIPAKDFKRPLPAVLVKTPDGMAVQTTTHA